PGPEGRSGWRAAVRQEGSCRGSLAPASDLGDLALFVREDVVDLADGLVGQLLHLLGQLLFLVRADRVALLLLLQEVQRIAADIADSHPRLLGIFVCDLDQLLPPLGVERRDRDAQQRALDDRVEDEVRLPYSQT